VTAVLSVDAVQVSVAEFAVTLEATGVPGVVGGWVSTGGGGVPPPNASCTASYAGFGL
jgi:hypothetical protein